MISVRGLHKQYGEHALFRGVSLEVRKGKAVVLIGPSGSGKSTLLRCINGLENFQQGSIIVDGIEIGPSGAGGHDRLCDGHIRDVRRRVGMVFQQFNLFPHKTVLENIIEAPVHVLGQQRESAVEEARLLLKRINLDHKTASYPERLSGGEQQRVAIVRALAMKPQAMLFDEPTSSLDPETVGEVLAVIRDLVTGGMTTVIATHEMDFARDVADRIAVFDQGEIIETGTPKEIFTDPRTERTRLFLSRIRR